MRWALMDISKYYTLVSFFKGSPSLATENIYELPGNDESTLYAQLSEILTDNITRDSVV